MPIKTRTYGNFYRLLNLLPNTDKEFWIADATNGRTTSLREMTIVEYGSMTRKMQLAVDEQEDAAYKKLDKARKRLIAAIGGYLKAQKKDGNNIVLIKAVACRATGGQYDQLNDIPLDRLNSLYAAFCNRKTDLLTVKEVDLTNPLAELNVMLEEAVAEEDYERAQKIKERIDNITKE